MESYAFMQRHKTEFELLHANTMVDGQPAKYARMDIRSYAGGNKPATLETAQLITEAAISMESMMELLFADIRDCDQTLKR